MLVPFIETGKTGKEPEFRSGKVGNQVCFIHIITSNGILYMFLHHSETVTFQLSPKTPKRFWQIYTDLFKK